MASILVVEDDEDIRPLIAGMLVKVGHTVRQAGNGLEGVRLYREAPADLVLTDVVMPEQEGLAMILELRRMNPAVRIIAMSGGFAYDPKLYLHMASRFGADRVLRKPFQFSELIDAVNGLLGAAPRDAGPAASGVSPAP
jgi:DNA-binding response OmpR family regulator